MPYDGDPVNSQTDAVRMLIRDTSTSSPRLTDNEVDWLVANHGNTYLAAAAGCEMMAAKHSSEPGSKSVGDLSIDIGSGDPSLNWTELAAQYRAQAARSGDFSFYSGGISKSDKQTRREDTDWDAVSAALKMHDNPNVGSTDGIWRGY